MNAQISRRNSVSTAASVDTRFAMLERLRKIIFSPSRRQAFALAATLTAALFGTSAAFAQSNEPPKFDPTTDYTINEGDSLTVYNNEDDLKHKDNDPSKTITLDGGTFSYQSDEDAKLGNTEGTLKNWQWGENGGTINVNGAGVLSIFNGDVNGANLAKIGAGKLVVESDGSNIAFGDLGVQGAFDCYSGGVGFDYETNYLGLIGDNQTTFRSQLNNSDKRDAIYVAQNQTLNVEVFNKQTASMITEGANFNSEGKIVLKSGDLVIGTRNVEGGSEELQLNVGDVEIISSGKGDEKYFKLLSGSFGDITKKEDTWNEDKNVTINIDGEIVFQGGRKDQTHSHRQTEEEKGDHSMYSGLAVFGETVITGKIDHNYGGQATWFGHVTLAEDGKYFSLAEIEWAKGTDSSGSYRACDIFENGLTVADNASLEVCDLTWGGKLEITDNGEAYLYGDSRPITNSETPTPSIELSKEGVLRSTLENVDVTTCFNDGGKLVLGNYNHMTDGRSSNAYVYSEDEFGRRTYLKMNRLHNTLKSKLRSTSDTNLRDYIHSATISGTGTIEINTPYSDSNDEVNKSTYLAILNGDKSQFTGDTNVIMGSLVLYSSAESREDLANRSNFQYGSDSKSGIFTVKGETSVTYKLNDKGEYVVEDPGTNGQLVFWRPEANGYKKITKVVGEGEEEDKYKQKIVLGEAGLSDASILFADKVNFESGIDVKKTGSEEKGAKLYFSTYYEQWEDIVEGKEYDQVVIDDDERIVGVVIDRSSARNLGTISANEINFSSNNYVWYDKVSLLSSDAAMTITLDAPVINIDGVQIDDSNSSELVELFNKPLIAVEALQIGEPEEREFGGYEIKANAVDVASYAKAERMSKREQQYAAIIDKNRMNPNNVEYYDALYNENDPSKVRQTIHNLSLANYQMLNVYGHFGNPTSSFFGGSTISGTHKRYQDPDPIFNSNNGGGQNAQESAIARQTVDDPSRAIWASYTNTFVDGKNYVDDEIEMRGYRYKRQGIVGGLKRSIDGSTSGGLFFALSNPEVASGGDIAGGYGRYSARMKMDDFQFAGHFEKVFNDFWELAAFVGGGTQSMDWKRSLDLTEGGQYRYTSKGSGNTLTGTLYLANRIDLSDNLALRPTIGVDSEHSWLYGFQENKELGGAAAKGYMNMFTQTYAYDQTYYNRNTARVGARVNWVDDTGYAGLNTWAFYGVQLGGKDSPLISYRSASYTFEDMATHAMGGESFSVGGGGYVYLNQAKTLTANGDYSAAWYKNATNQVITGGLSYQF